MPDYILDASAVLALLNDEEGASLVQDCLQEAVMSAANLAEVVTRLSAASMPEYAIRDSLALLGLEIEAFNEEQAYQAGLIYSKVKIFSLSLGDRACLALARRLGAVAVTADRAWGNLEVGVAVKVIR